LSINLGRLHKRLSHIIILCLLGWYTSIYSQGFLDTIYPAAWAGNSINTVIFRKNSLTSNDRFQYVSFYDSVGYVVIGRRLLGSQDWTWKKLPYRGNILDAHNAINIQLDGLGYLHVAWDHHNQPLKYFRSNSPGSLEFEPMQVMVGKDETAVSYPEFYKKPDGDLFFLYRNGTSGNGNLVINTYHTETASWDRLHDNLIDGKGQRNAYWQATVDGLGAIHISWTWRETPDVASNHDICYAVSHDGGLTWKRSDGTKYKLPITAQNAEYVHRIPQNSELINQTSMTCDDSGHPFIATYWKYSKQSVPQYQVIYLMGKKWISQSLYFRKTDFSLGGVGTRSIPISRPQIVVWNDRLDLKIGLIFRDQERGNKPSIAIGSTDGKKLWSISELDDHNLDRWEPSFDPDLWNSSKLLHLFIQQVSQIDAEGFSIGLAKPISILEWRVF